MTDGIDEFRVLPENVNSYLEKGFMLMCYCKYCDSYYLPKTKKRKRITCGSRKCTHKHFGIVNKDRYKKVRHCKECKVKVSKGKQYCKSCKEKQKLIYLETNRIYHRREDIIKRNKERARNYILSPEAKIKKKIRSRVHNALKYYKKCAYTEKLLGCSLDEFKEHIEKQFLPGMSWENNTRHGWHIDHIRPISSFDLSKPEEQLKAFHYTNCQPLWAKDNLSKAAKYHPNC